MPPGDLISDSPMLSIVTATWNNLAYSKPYLESLLAHPPPAPWELVWVDDGSTDGTRDWLRGLPAARHRVLLNEHNLGFAGANNRGANMARGDVLALLNNDLVLTSGWCAPMLESLGTIAKVGAVGNVQLDAKTGRVDHAGVCFNLVGTGEHHLRGSSRPPPGPGAFHPAVTAACLLIRRDVFFAHQGFDENYRNGCEDLDLCLRLSGRGFRHWVDHRSVIHHHVSASRGRREGDLNLRRFLQTWGEKTHRIGQAQWPRHYLRKYLHQPSRYNPIKVMDALLRLARLRDGDSAWAARQRRRLLGDPAT
jgi:GT2 family glycosyltransferase